MKTELVNLFTNDKTETVVLLLATELDVLTPAERVRAPNSRYGSSTMSWTVMTTADSPLASVVRKGPEAMHGTYRSYERAAAGRIDKAGVHMPPQHLFGR